METKRPHRLAHIVAPPPGPDPDRIPRPRPPRSTWPPPEAVSMVATTAVRLSPALVLTALWFVSRFWFAAFAGFIAGAWFVVTLVRQMRHRR